MSAARKLEVELLARPNAHTQMAAADVDVDEGGPAAQAAAIETAVTTTTTTAAASLKVKGVFPQDISSEREMAIVTLTAGNSKWKYYKKTILVNSHVLNISAFHFTSQ